MWTYIFCLDFQCILFDSIDYQEFEGLTSFYLVTDIQTVIAELKIRQSKTENN